MQPFLDWSNIYGTEEYDDRPVVLYKLGYIWISVSEHHMKTTDSRKCDQRLMLDSAMGKTSANSDTNGMHGM